MSSGFCDRFGDYSAFGVWTISDILLQWRREAALRDVMTTLAGFHAVSLHEDNVSNMMLLLVVHAALHNMCSALDPLKPAVYPSSA